MNRAFHIDATKQAALLCGWPGNVNLLASSAAWPDDVCCIAVEGHGAHLLGHNLASLTHFCRPITDPTETVFRGYNYHRDRSLPHLDLPDRTVTTIPTAWGAPLTRTEAEHDPFHLLIEKLSTDFLTSRAADEITFTQAGVMAGWLGDCIDNHADNQTAVDQLAGWLCHFAQDACVPHHAMGLLGLGHQGFEGDLDERYSERVAEGSILAALTASHPPLGATDLRTFVEGLACASTTSLWRLRLGRVWGWQGLIDGAINRALGGTFTLLQGLLARLDKEKTLP